jgi:hypothetical protein
VCMLHSVLSWGPCWLQEREADLKLLVAALRRGKAASVGPDAPVCGAIPTHLRRRTRSHARLQMPLRLRLKPRLQLARVPVAERCRLHRRVASRLRAAWAARPLVVGRVEGALLAECWVPGVLLGWPLGLLPVWGGGWWWWSWGGGVVAGWLAGWLAGRLAGCMAAWRALNDDV